MLVGVAAGPALADGGPSTTVAGASIVTVPPNQTRILPGGPAGASATPGPAVTATAVPGGSSAGPQETAATVSADSPALRALVDVTTTDQRRAAGAVSQSESGVAGLRGAFDAAQADLSARQADEQSAAALVAAAQAELDTAEARVAAAELAAASAADAVGSRRTPVASPPSRGHSPSDHAVQARAELAAAAVDRDGRRTALADHQHDLDTARAAAAGAGQSLTARADDLQRGLDGLDQARRQLTGDAGTGGAGLLPAPTALALATIPADYLALYGRAAATCPGLSWLLLAGIGSVESAHGQSPAAGVRAGANAAGAMGPMQFLAATWSAYGADGDGDGVRDVYDPADAIFGVAGDPCATGAGNVSTLRRALWEYNHADWYVEQVLAMAARY